MTRSQRLFLLLCLLPLFGFAQQTTGNVYRIEKDSLPEIQLAPSFLEVAPDPAGKLTVGQAAEARFQPVKSTTVRFDTSTIYWLRYYFQNTLNRPVTLWLETDMDRSDFYTPDSTGRWTHKVSGSGVPWSARADQKELLSVRFIIGPGKILPIYQRMSFAAGEDAPRLKVTFHIGDNIQPLLQDYFDKEHFKYSYYSALSGLLLLAAIITLLFYSVSREKVFLWFTFFGLSFALPELTGQFFDPYFREHPQLDHDMVVLFFLPVVLLPQFLAAFYDVPQHYPRWHRLNQFSAGLLLVSAASRTLWAHSSGLTLTLTQVSLLLFVCSNALALLWGIFRRGPGRAARMASALPFVILTAAFVIVLILPSILTNSSSLADRLTNWLAWITTGCFYWLIISFMWSLVRRFQRLQKQVLQETLEKERIAREHEQERLALMEAQQELLERQVEERTLDLQQSLSDLKQAQNQLVQSEKMASLGELTAGIAHEIQNPLNFVNNFSEVSLELTAEMKEEAKAGHTADVLEIAEDLRLNLEKIHHHGKRADHIVKGMLEHSRAGNGRKEPTDLNKLAGEYLQLAFHGLRAKNKEFNVLLVTSFDDGLPEVTVVAQEIGRVLLNLFNNAFYAVAERQKIAGNDYQPTVELTTGLRGDKIMLTVKDNGDGIPEAIRDKIMQPFFTTKPTGQGTGLGLSLSYDIIVKGHAGAIDVQSEAGEGAVFSIWLPFGK